MFYKHHSSYIRFGTKLYRQIVGIPIVTNCASLLLSSMLFFPKIDSINIFVKYVKYFSSTAPKAHRRAYSIPMLRRRSFFVVRTYVVHTLKHLLL